MTIGVIGTKLNATHSPITFFKHSKDFSKKALRRGKLEIVAEILQFCKQQKTKASIMHNANLNYAQLNRHMDTLLNQGLIAEEANKFSTTEKGNRFISLFDELYELIKQIEKIKGI